MHWGRSVRRVAVLSTLLTVMCSTWTFADDEAPSADRRMGNDVVAYFSIHNIAKLKEEFSKTAIGQMVADPEIKPFIEQFHPLWEKASTEFENNMGIPLTDVLGVASGEFSIGVSQNSKGLSPVAFLNFGEHGETLDKLLEKLSTALTESGVAKRSEEEIEGTSVVVYTFAAEEAEEEEEPADKKKKPANNTLVYFIKDSYLVVSNRTESLKAVLTRWDGKNERVFADKSVYKYIAEKCRGKDEERQPQVTWYLDPIGLTKGFMVLGGADPTAQAMALGFLPSLGVDKFKAMGGSVDFATEDFDTVTRMLVYVEQPQSGVMNIFNFPSKVQAPPSWVTASANTFAAMNWDIAGAYAAIETLHDTFRGAGSLAQMMDELAEQDEGPKIHIKKDIIDQLPGGLLVTSSSPSNTEDGEFPVEQYLLGLELKDEKEFGATVEKLVEFAKGLISSREFEGTKIYEISSAEEEGPFKPAIAIGKQHLLFASNVEALEAILRGGEDQESLVKSELYQRVAKFFPEQTSTLSFQRSDAQMKAIYEAAKNGALDSVMENNDELQIDFSKLPDFDVLKKYLTPSGGYMRSDERGWFIEGFSLKP